MIGKMAASTSCRVVRGECGLALEGTKETPQLKSTVRMSVMQSWLNREEASWAAYAAYLWACVPPKRPLGMRPTQEARTLFSLISPCRLDASRLLLHGFTGISVSLPLCCTQRACLTKCYFQEPPAILWDLAKEWPVCSWHSMQIPPANHTILCQNLSVFVSSRRDPHVLCIEKVSFAAVS